VNSSATSEEAPSLITSRNGSELHAAHTCPNRAACRKSRSKPSSARRLCRRYAHSSLPQQHVAAGCGMLVGSGLLRLCESRNDWIASASAIVWEKRDWVGTRSHRLVDKWVRVKMCVEWRHLRW